VLIIDLSFHFLLVCTFESVALQSQDRSLKALWGECRKDSIQTCVLVLYRRDQVTMPDVTLT